MVRDWCQNCISVHYLGNGLIEVDPVLYMLWYWQDVELEHMKKAWVLSYPLSAQRRLWSDWADAQADLSLRWAPTHFVGFVTRRLTHKLMPFRSWLLLLTEMKTILNNIKSLQYNSSTQIGTCNTVSYVLSMQLQVLIFSFLHLHTWTRLQNLKFSCMLPSLILLVPSYKVIIFITLYFKVEPGGFKLHTHRYLSSQFDMFLCVENCVSPNTVCFTCFILIQLNFYVSCHVYFS